MPKRFTDALDALDQRCKMTVEHLERIHPQWQKSARDALAGGLQEPGRALAERLEEISNDADLSADGKKRRAGDAQRDALQEVTIFKANSVEVFRSRAAQLEEDILKAATFRPPTDPAERMAYEMRAAELRGQLRERDPLEVWALYLSADSPEVRHIIESSHPVVREVDGKATLAPLVDPEQLEASREERAIAAAPAEQAQELEALRYCADAYDGAANILRAAILEEGGHALEASISVEVGAGE